MSTEDNPGYVLRISTEEWLKQVFERGKYYSGVMRKWRRGTPILLAKKAGASDCFVGYGVVDKVEMLWVIIYKSVVSLTSRTLPHRPLSSTTFTHLSIGFSNSG